MKNQNWIHTLIWLRWILFRSRLWFFWWFGDLLLWILLLRKNAKFCHGTRVLLILFQQTFFISVNDFNFILYPFLWLTFCHWQQLNWKVEKFSLHLHKDKNSVFFIRLTIEVATRVKRVKGNKKPILFQTLFLLNIGKKKIEPSIKLYCAKFLQLINHDTLYGIHFSKKRWSWVYNHLPHKLWIVDKVLAVLYPSEGH